MQPWDRWWNRKFPPYSYRRLGFLLACSLFISPGVVLLRTIQSEEPFSWTFAAFLWLGTATMLTLSWVHIRGHADLDDLDKAARWRPPGMPPPPPPPDFPEDLWRGGQGPGLDGDELERDALARLTTGPVRRPPRFDLLYSVVILFIGFTAVTFAMSSEPWAPLTLGINLAFAAFTALLFALRYSIFSAILLSAVVAIPMAMMLYMFFFWLGGGEVWEYYAISFVVAFVFVFPLWWRFRESRKVAVLANIPMWMLSVGATVMLILASVTTASMEDPSLDKDRPEKSFAAPVDFTADKSFGGSSREDAALRLFFAWKNNARATAETVAEDQAIEDLFSQPFDAGARFLGCGIDGNGYSKCATWTPQGLVLSTPHINGNGNMYIVSVERVPHDHPFELSAPAAPTPTP